jgi:WD40 repeat protein
LKEQKNKAAGESLAAKQSPHRPDIVRALPMRARRFPWHLITPAALGAEESAMAWLSQKHARLPAPNPWLHWKWFFPLLLVGVAAAGAFLVQTSNPVAESIVGRQEYWIRALAFAPDGTKIAVAGGLVDRRQELVVWELTTGRRQTLLVGEGPAIEAIGFSPDGLWLGLVQGDQTVRLLKAATGNEEARFHTAPHWQQDIGFSPDGRELLVPNADDALFVWDIAAKRLQRRPLPERLGINYACLPQGLLVSDRNPSLTAPPATVGAYGMSASHASSPAAENGVTGAEVCVWDAVGRQALGHFRLPMGTIMTAAAVAPNRSQAAVATADGGLFFFDLRNGRTCLAGDGRAGESRLEPAERVNCLAFSPDGDRLVSGSQERVVKLWDTATARELARLGEHDAAVFAVAFSPDGRQVASGGFDKVIRLWNVDGLSKSAPLVASLASRWQVRFSGGTP